MPEHFSHRLCDKCGQPVPADNDALRFDIILTGNTWMAGERPRHLIATPTCPGSPSRAQYLEGQPRDTRSQYPYVDAHEKRLRDTYDELLRQAAEPDA